MIVRADYGTLTGPMLRSTPSKRQISEPARVPSAASRTLFSSRLVTKHASFLWSSAMESAIAGVQKSTSRMETLSGSEILKALAERGRFLLLQLHKNQPTAFLRHESYLFGDKKTVGGFGEQRIPMVPGDEHGIHRTHFRTVYSAHAQAVHHALEVNGVENYRPDPEVSGEEIVRGYSSFHSMHATQVRLTEVFLSFPTKAGQVKVAEPFMRCIPCHRIPEVLKALDFEVLQWFGEISKRAPTIQTLGRIHALASHAWCFHRGNAALAHMLVRVLADSARFTLGKVVPGRDPNIDALITPDVVLYGKQFSTHFLPVSHSKVS